MAALVAAPRCCLTSPAGDYLSRQGVAVSLVNHRLRRAACPPPAVHLDQAQAVHSFLLQVCWQRTLLAAHSQLHACVPAMHVEYSAGTDPLLCYHTTLIQLPCPHAWPP
jgi:hypothetical protein